MTREEWLATSASLETIIEYAKMEANNDIYYYANLLRTMLLKKGD